jgi:hypothetical protein
MDLERRTVSLLPLHNIQTIANLFQRGLYGGMGMDGFDLKFQDIH